MNVFSPEAPKLPGEGLDLTLDYSQLLQSGETISTCPWTCEVYEGVDANPGAMVSGASGISGSKVTQHVVGGLSGVTYLFTAMATTNQGRILAGQGILAVGSVQ
jgi:hypothetical protein